MYKPHFGSEAFWEYEAIYGKYRNQEPIDILVENFENSRRNDEDVIDFNKLYSILLSSSQGSRKELEEYFNQLMAVGSESI